LPNRALDSDYATDPRDRKSLLGFILMVHRGVVLHYSKKINAVARSTTEAETVGISEALKTSHMAAEVDRYPLRGTKTSYQQFLCSMEITREQYKEHAEPQTPQRSSTLISPITIS
jgi:hypothetical protein